MAYTRVNWKDYPETDTPITAANLNKMDTGIKEVDTRVDSLSNLFIYNADTGALTIDLDVLGE